MYVCVCICVCDVMCALCMCVYNVVCDVYVLCVKMYMCVCIHVCMCMCVHVCTIPVNRPDLGRTVLLLSTLSCCPAFLASVPLFSSGVFEAL